MSAILQALQKNNLSQATNSAPMFAEENSGSLLWKILASLAVLTIIGLLSTLIYLQLYPRHEAPQPVANITKLRPVTPHSNIVKVSFDTQPIAPLPATPRKVVTEQPKQPVTVATVKAPARGSEEDPLVYSLTPDKSKLILPTKTVDSSDNSESAEDIDYEAVPDDLKKRFELALMLTEMEDSPEDVEYTNEPDDNLDGSDIRQMSSSFQRKVAPISYESHMYSSLLADRWIRINGETLKEGDFDSTGELELLEIEPQRSVFRVQRQSFSLESLTDWKGY